MLAKLPPAGRRRKEFRPRTQQHVREAQQWQLHMVSQRMRVVSLSGQPCELLVERGSDGRALVDVVQKISGALALFRGFPPAKILPYAAAQVLGAFLGAAMVYLLFSPVIDHYNALHHLSRNLDGGAAGVFFTHPGLAITPLHAFGDEIVLTGILVLGIFAITEEFNTLAPAANAGALLIGLLVATIGACAGYLEAWPINPARDFGPRLFCFFTGWGAQAFPAPQNYWWVPIAGPLLGGVAGGALYQGAIRPFLPARRQARADNGGAKA